MSPFIQEFRKFHDDIAGGPVIDRVFRLLVNAAPLNMVRAVTGMNATSFRATDGELPAGNRTLRCDLLGFALVDGDELLIHFEYQTTNAPEFEYRMYHYAGAAHERYKIGPHPYALYLNRESCSLKAEIVGPTMTFRYTIVDFSATPPDAFLAEGTPNCLVFAILCNFENESVVIAENIERLRAAVANPDEFERYLFYLSTLAGRLNRKKMEQINAGVWAALPPERQAEMEMNSFVQEWLSRGEERGEERGKAIGEARVRLQMLKDTLAYSRDFNIPDEVFRQKYRVSDAEWPQILNGHN